MERPSSVDVELHEGVGPPSRAAREMQEPTLGTCCHRAAGFVIPWRSGRRRLWWGSWRPAQRWLCDHVRRAWPCPLPQGTRPRRPGECATATPPWRATSRRTKRTGPRRTLIENGSRGKLAHSGVRCAGLEHCLLQHPTFPGDEHRVQIPDLEEPSIKPCGEHDAKQHGLGESDYGDCAVGGGGPMVDVYVGFPCDPNDILVLRYLEANVLGRGRTRLTFARLHG